ncbi:MAG TPA: tetratricopeptide repeat protein [Gammaproteobacteria bacterium]
MPAYAAMQDDFAAGVAAAQRRDYAVALQYFESAARAGMREPLLYYNLGVSYYNEYRLDEAEDAFRRAVASPKLAALSYYNLGLIARDRGLREQAANWFQQAETAAQTPQLSRLASQARRELTDSAPSGIAAPWLVWIQGYVGHDSNATLSADFEAETAGRDETRGFSAYGHYNFARLRLHGLIDTQHYSTADDFNFDTLENGISLPLSKNGWEFRPGLNVRYMQLAGEPMQSSAGLFLENSGPVGGFDLKFYVEHEAVNAAAGFEYLEGTSSFFQLSADNEHWRFIWDIESNEREDLFDTANEEFFSFSPQQRGWQVAYKDSLTAMLDLELTTGLQRGKYHEPDIRADGRVLRRQDVRQKYNLKLGYGGWRHWRSAVELGYIKKDSNFTEFIYDRGILTLSLERSFGK